MSEGSTPFILCENLVKIFKVEDVEVVALQGLDLTVGEREVVAIIGPSGSGKSSLMNLLGGLDTPSAGKIRVAGRDLVSMSAKERTRYRRDTVGFVWQNVSRNLIPYLSALENVELPMILSGTFRRKQAHRLLEIVGLGKRKHHPPGRMSGGEQQRVAIAIALANNPALLLADEPTGSLDRENTRLLLNVFDTVRNELGVTVVIVTHDRSIARAVDRYLEIRDGKTTREAVRKTSGLTPLDAVQEIHDPVGGGSPTASPETHEHYTLLDAAGRLQIPPDLLESHGIKGRVRLVEEDGRIVILPEKQTSTEPAGPEVPRPEEDPGDERGTS
ncbi:MAG TPA: ATP-binding cassette domain-containing protein [Spirochaetia bacterium]|nr:ATP-binding cassette domain-containing protein [Spirochaetia bacterium]